jgi:hypothetical protein
MAGRCASSVRSEAAIPVDLVMNLVSARAAEIDDTRPHPG